MREPSKERKSCGTTAECVVMDGWDRREGQPQSRIWRLAECTVTDSVEESDSHDQFIEEPDMEASLPLLHVDKSSGHNSTDGSVNHSGL